jgi:DNA-directed RNA polymerase subunit RPC12/RpoP
MDIRFACSNCGQHLAADPSDTGQTFPCPYCHRVVVVPGRQPTAPPGPKPVPQPSPIVKAKSADHDVTPNPRQHSRLGLVSLLLSTATGMMLLLSARWGVQSDATVAVGINGMVSNPVALGLLLFAMAFAALLALGLGVFALFQTDRKKLLGLLGAAVSTTTLVMAVLRMMRGF